MQNRINDQAAFILHRRDYQDSSLILNLLTEDYGRLNVLVKAAKKRRDASNFQICNRLSVGWSGQSELKLLTQVDCHRILVLPENIPSVFYINELLLYFLPVQQEYNNLFHRYQTLLIELSHTDTVLESELRNFEMELLSELGYMPDLSIDVTLNKKINAENNYVLDATSGLELADKADQNSFTGVHLLAIHDRQFHSPDLLMTAKRIMRQIIDFNLNGRTLQSRKFYQQMNKK